ncbi:MAG TPA: glycosyltransferase, partial [Gemmatimonadales bacterium]
ETYRAFGCTSCGIEVIPNFVNLAEYFPATDVRCRPDLAPKDAKIVMHVSNFREVKRVPDIVRAFAKIRQEVKSVLILVGDGPEREDSEREAERLGVAKHVRFLGKLDAIADLLRAADVFLLPSSTESFGLAALEALACGVPVVASNVGGLPEVVDESCGALVPVGDVDALAGKSIELLRDAKRWDGARKAAVDRARTFAAESIVPQYEQLYQQVVG